MAANIFASSSIRDEGQKGSWRLDYNVLVRQHLRYRKRLYNPAKAELLLEGVHLGIIRPARVTFVTFEGGTTTTYRDVWSAGERATNISGWWKGETHFELNVSSEQPLQDPVVRLAPPLGLSLQDVNMGDASGLSQDEASTGRQNARLEESGSDFWRLRGLLLERVHQQPRTLLYERENHLLPVTWSREYSL